MGNFAHYPNVIYKPKRDKVIEETEMFDLSYDTFSFLVEAGSENYQTVYILPIYILQLFINPLKPTVAIWVQL